MNEWFDEEGSTRLRHRESVSESRWFLNPKAVPAAPWPTALEEVLGEGDHRDARREISSWPGYAPTPLRRLSCAAPGSDRAGLRVPVWVKDESRRFGLGSFKALGGAYGVRRAVRDHGGAADGTTVVCASDGNHGRSVAWGARTQGCDAVVYLPSHVTAARAGAIRGLGARVVRVAGEYDEAVARAARDARANGWTVVSDTSSGGGERGVRRVMAGYTVMVEEALLEWRRAVGDVGPTHVFVQGGVGGLAAAVIGHLWRRMGEARPTTVVVEPTAADGLLESAVAGEPAASRGDLDTVMAGLSCRRASPLAWRIVGAGAHAFATAPDAGVEPLMRRVAKGDAGEPFEGGESGVAGLLGLEEALRDPRRRRDVGLGRRSRVLAFNTEGATDPELYRRIVG